MALFPGARSRIVLLVVCVSSTLNLFWERGQVRTLVEDPEVSKESHVTQTYHDIPSCHRMVIFNEWNRSMGYGTHMNRILEAMLVADLTNSTFVLDQTGVFDWNYDCGKGWECFYAKQLGNCRHSNGSTIRVEDWYSRRELLFETMTPIVSSTHPDRCKLFKQRKMRKKQVILMDHEIPQDNHYLLQDNKCMETHVHRTALHQAEVLNLTKTEQRDRLRSMYERYMEPIPPTTIQGPYIGVHIRRGDKYEFKMVRNGATYGQMEAEPLSAFVEIVNYIYNQTKIQNVFAASDDPKVLEEFRELLLQSGPPNVTVLNNPAPTTTEGGFDQRKFNDEANGQERQRVVKDLLREIYQLAQADYFIGTFSSNIGRWVVSLSSQPLHHLISLDSEWWPGPARFSLGSTDYCEFPEANQGICQDVIRPARGG